MKVRFPVYEGVAYAVKDSPEPVTPGNLNDLLAECFPLERCRILLRESDVSPEFFDLSTGVAGEVLQKFVNYSVSAVLVVETFEGKSDRFLEMASESARKPGGFGVFAREEEAVRWLCGD